MYFQADYCFVFHLDLSVIEAVAFPDAVSSISANSPAETFWSRTNGILTSPRSCPRMRSVGMWLSPSEGGRHERLSGDANVGGSGDYNGSRVPQCFDFSLNGGAFAGYHGPGVAHALAGRSGGPNDKGAHGLREIRP